MDRKLLLVIAVLALAACQAKKTNEVVVAPVPAMASVTPTPAPIVEPVTLKPVETVAVVTTPAPVAVSTAPAVETKPVAAITPQVVSAPVVSKPTSPAVIAKPATPPVPLASKEVTPTVSNVDGIALGKKRNCFACHMVDKKVVGPAWKDVAAKYRGDASAQARMEAKISKGGAGAWGSMAMPPQPQVSVEERAILARFILNLK